ncbi:pyridoxal phosphate-dependent aminotransferase family protein (plasmid) [Rhizobium sullae]|uniref:Pyridoxal phosphate-dependent aminotransferase family protein n=1 Tax=Rhizobium sullae TaxID=50338 RepID=A0ABY5XZH2_RHISU|nr:pyridoxal phosphate-dependent aminotransferase family protein [Rhizobium sullae]UWU19509.1 pyridoxal phosphate-dependent aminotransferase family protein [Rhizobium sullae]
MEELPEGLQFRMESPVGPRMRIDGREVSYFSGTSYHTLHGHPVVIDAAIKALQAFGLGSGTHAAISVYEEAEAAVCAHFRCEKAISVASGYLSMMTLLSALRDDYDIIFADERCHFSVKDALICSQKPVVLFRHRDPGDLSDQMARHLGEGQVPHVVTDGVFSSTGALAPLDRYAHLLKSYSYGMLCVDDSHGVGVLGATGRGTLEHFGVEGENAHSAGTLSKAFGGFGGIIPASKVLAKKIAATGAIAGASFVPIPAAAGAAAGLRLFMKDQTILQALRGNVEQMRKGFRSLGLSVPETPVPIFTIQADVDLRRVNKALRDANIIVKYMKAGGYADAPPVETLRVAVFSSHSHGQIDELVSVLRKHL